MKTPNAKWILLIKKYCYLVVIITILLPLSGIILGHYLNLPNGFTFLTPIVLFFIVPLLDYFLGHDPINPNNEQYKILDQQFYYRILGLVCLPLVLGLVIFGAYYFSSGNLNLLGKIGWALSVGTISGGIGIVLAHELIHKNSWYERMAGGLLLVNVCYATFKVEHIRGHHISVATESDISTAKYHQSLYSFLIQTLRHNFLNGWHLERIRLNKIGLSAYSLQNELIKWYVLTFLLGVALTLSFGWQALIFFLLQSFVAIILLETTNYIEHYGLLRKKLPSGRDEPVSEFHSWNSDYLLSNLILFQLQRHSDHHMAAKRRYQTLIHRESSPQLPGGYPLMVLLAFIPPLWFRVIHPRIPLQSTQQTA
jgi:alkane 1-monooxygenase